MQLNCGAIILPLNALGSLLKSCEGFLITHILILSLIIIFWLMGSPVHTNSGSLSHAYLTNGSSSPFICFCIYCLLAFFLIESLNSWVQELGPPCVRQYTNTRQILS